MNIDHKERVAKLKELHDQLSSAPALNPGIIHEVLMVLLEEAMEARGGGNERVVGGGNF